MNARTATIDSRDFVLPLFLLLMRMGGNAAASVRPIKIRKCMQIRGALHVLAKTSPRRSVQVTL